MSNRKCITPQIKKQILEKQNNKCANSIINPAINLKEYACPMWLLYNGTFDLSGYQFDHIDEFSITRNDNIENLQALCNSCHAVKTKLFSKNKYKLTSTEMHNGNAIMEIDKIYKKRKRD